MAVPEAPIAALSSTDHSTTSSTSSISPSKMFNTTPSIKTHDLANYVGRYKYRPSSIFVDIGLKDGQLCVSGWSDSDLMYTLKFMRYNNQLPSSPDEPLGGIIELHELGDRRSQREARGRHACFIMKNGRLDAFVWKEVGMSDALRFTNVIGKCRLLKHLPEEIMKMIWEYALTTPTSEMFVFEEGAHLRFALAEHMPPGGRENGFTFNGDALKLPPQAIQHAPMHIQSIN